MRKVEATPMDCIVCYCPYCDKRIVEEVGDMRDITGVDIEEEGELECPHCNKEFEYFIEI